MTLACISRGGWQGKSAQHRKIHTQSNSAPQMSKTSDTPDLQENATLGQGLARQPQEVSGEIWFITLSQLPTDQILESHHRHKRASGRDHTDAKTPSKHIQPQEHKTDNSNTVPYTQTPTYTHINPSCRHTKVAREPWRSIAHRGMGP